MTAHDPVADLASTAFNTKYQQESWWGGSKVEFDRNTNQYFIRVWVAPGAAHNLPAKTESGVKIEVISKALRTVGKP